jgi:hypothetical protein
MKKRLAILAMAFSLTFSFGVRAETTPKEVESFIAFVYQHTNNSDIIDAPLLDLVDCDNIDADKNEGELVVSIKTLVVEHSTSFAVEDRHKVEKVSIRVIRLYRRDDGSYFRDTFVNKGDGWYSPVGPQDWE